MGSWQQLVDEAPVLAAAVQARFESAKHHILATLRRDGSPRVSGTEVQFHQQDLVIGMMHGSVKARDLQHDGRFAMHAHPGDCTLVGGDAKVSGRADEVTDPAAIAAYTGEVSPPEPFHLFRLDLQEVVLTSIHPEGDRLVIEVWRPGQTVTAVDRY